MEMATLLALMETPEPAHMTMKPRAGTLPVGEVSAAVDRIYSHSEASERTRQLAKAALLLWHDQFEAAHEIVQDMENPDAALLHGILHRRELDFSNARYWFHRVGAHQSFDCVVGKVKVVLLTSVADIVAMQIVPQDKWHPLPFVDVLETHGRRNEPSVDMLLRQIQRAEIQCFLESLPSRG